MSAEKEVQAVFYIGIEQAKEIVDLTDLNPLEVKAVKFVSYGESQAFAEFTVVREISFDSFINIVKGEVK